MFYIIDHSLSMRFQFGLLCFCISTFYFGNSQDLGRLEINNFYQIEQAYNAAEISKILADEYFISWSLNGEQVFYDKAKSNYLTALKFLEKVKLAKIDDANSSKLVDFKNEKRLLLEYLEKDAFYRLMLLKSKLPFYGSEANLTPENPLNVYTNYVQSLESLNTVYKDIEQLFSSIKDDDEIISDNELNQELNSYEKRINKIENNSLRIQTDYLAKRYSTIKSKKEAYINEQIEVDKELSSNLSEIDNAYNSFNKAVTNGIVAASGIPPELKGLVNGKPLDDIVEDAAMNYLSGQLASAFKDEIDVLSETYSEAYKVYETAKEIEDKFNDAKTASDRLQKFFSEGSVESLVRIGGGLYSQLQPEVIRELEKTVIESEEYVTLLKLSKYGEELREKFSAEILKEYSRSWKRVQEEVNKVIDNSSGDIETTYKNIIASYRNVDVFSGSRNDYDHLFKLITKVQKEEILNLFCSNSNEVEIMNSFLEEGKRFSVNNNGLVSMEGFAKKLNLQYLLKSLGEKEVVKYERRVNQDTNSFKEKVKNDIQKLKNETKAFITDLELAGSLSIENQIRILSSLSDNATHEFLANIKFEREETSEIYKKAIQSLSPVDQSAFYRKVIQLQLGGKAIAREKSPLCFKDTLFNRSRFRQIPENGNDAIVRSRSNSRDLNNENSQKLVTTALFGAYGAGYEGLRNVIESNNRIDDLLDKHETFKKKSKALTAIITQLVDQESNSLNNLGIAKAKYDAVQVLHKALEAKHKGYDNSLKNRLKSKTVKRVKISLALRILYYELELLRKYFYELNNTHKLWYGISFNEIVSQSPENLRYAIDDDILLFDWLQNDIDSERANLDELVTKWNGINSIIRDNCPSCKSGFKRQDVAQTNPIKLSSLVIPGEWDRFKEWQKGDSQKDFNLTFKLPLNTPYITSKNVDNVRIIELSLVGAEIKRSKAISVPFNGNSVTLDHPGIAIVKNNNSYVTDLLKPFKNATLTYQKIPNYGEYNIDDFPPSFNLDELSSRWNDDKSRPTRAFEGYSPYCLWVLILSADQKTKKVDDIFMRIAYQYVSSSKEPKFKDFTLEITTIGGNNISLSGDDLDFLRIGEFADLEILAKKYKNVRAIFGQPFSSIKVTTGSSEPFASQKINEVVIESN